jgi:DNA-binding NtrC family response regulator
MKTAKRLIVVSPFPEQICLAAACRKDWDEIVVGGSVLVESLFQAIAGQRACRELIVLLPKIKDSTAVRLRLEAMGRAGIQLRWFASGNAGKIADACRNLPNVSLETAATVKNAVAAAYPGLLTTNNPLKRIEDGDRDLEDWLRYRCSLCLMSDLDPTPLKSACDHLAKGGKIKVPADDNNSVARFHEAEFPYIEGHSDVLQDLRRRVRQVGATELSVLILGETGTGKESVAFYLHEFSERRAGPFVALNCAGLDETFLRSELFGHEKGSFTGATSEKKGLVEHADGGTLFLDELAELSLPIQAELLRFVQTRKYRRLGATAEKTADVRIVAATHPDLEDRIERKIFRSDLYFRLAEVEIRTPALKEIPSDIIQVVRHLTYRIAEKTDDRADVRKHLKYFEDARDILATQPWPGNVRQVAGMVKRRIQLGDDVLKDLDARPALAAKSMAGGTSGTAVARPISEVVHEYVTQTYFNRGKKTQRQIAAELDCSVNTLKKLLQKSQSPA